MSDTAGTGFIERGRHPVSIGHLVMGLAFLGLLGVWAFVQGDVIDNDEIRWLLPLPWVLAGVAGLTASVLSGRRHVQRQTGWVPPTATEPDLRLDVDEDLGQDEAGPDDRTLS